MSLEKIINLIAIVMLLMLASIALIVMQKTTESNAIVMEQATRKAKKRSKMYREVKLLGVEIENLQKDVSQIRKMVEEEKTLGTKSR